MNAQPTLKQDRGQRPDLSVPSSGGATIRACRLRDGLLQSLEVASYLDPLPLLEMEPSVFRQ
jgi:hypothetical protein